MFHLASLAVACWGMLGFSVALAEPPAAPAKPVQLRVLSYNIHHCEGIDGVLDVDRIARVITSVQPDLVALQEVDRGAERSQQVDQPKELARLTKMNFAAGPNLLNFQGGDYGNALLSKFPIRSSQNTPLPLIDDKEQRGLLEAEIELPGGDTLSFLVTHFDHHRDSPARPASARVVNSRAKALRDQPAILAGDFNDTPGSVTLTELEKEWTRSSQDVTFTIPSQKPKRQIDFIFVRPKDRWRLIETRVLEEPIASDHRPILAVFELLPKSQEK